MSWRPTVSRTTCTKLVHVDVEELAVQAFGERVGGAHQRARGDPVDPALEPLVELGAVEGQEVGALPALHVDHLDVLALGGTS